MDAGPLGGGRSRTGWIAFAGAYLLVAGVMNGIWGLAALTDREFLREGALAWSNLDDLGLAFRGRRREPASRRAGSCSRGESSAACSPA